MVITAGIAGTRPVWFGAASSGGERYGKGMYNALKGMLAKSMGTEDSK
ncbi:MAG: hypothetical protein ACYC27_22080 [Armatimonadota bacterium]